MAILVRGDPGHIGHALLSLDPERDGPLAISIQFLDRTFLGPDGRRTRERHLFPAETRSPPGLYGLGPAITAHVPVSEVVTLADQNGVGLGTVQWEDIRILPEAGRGTLIGLGARLPAPANEPSDAPIGDPSTPDRASEHPPDAALEPAVLAPAKRNVGAGLWVLSCLVLGLLGFASLVLGGRIGWEIDPPVLSFSGAAGGRFQPAVATTRLRALWYAKPFARILAHPFRTSEAPPWLALRQDAGPEGYDLQASIAAAAEALPAGDHRFRVRVGFPLGGDAAGHGVDVALHIDEPPPLLSAPIPPQTVAPPDPASVPPPSLVDDDACDRIAGNRFDPDHPSGHAFVDEVFDTGPEQIEKGIAWCDARTDRTGPDRRFVVQRGRLIAARALQRASAGDLPGARRDMDDALTDWRTGSALGSAFADSLLGAYAFGSFNRPAITFAQPDDTAATSAWKRGTERGSAVAERNYAAQLLYGRGTPGDPLRAIALLHEALARGDERAAGVLGVALYTGFPAGVPTDRAEGWSLVARAQCVDKASADLLANEIGRGARPAADRRICR